MIATLFVPDLGILQAAMGEPLKMDKENSYEDMFCSANTTEMQRNYDQK